MGNMHLWRGCITVVLLAILFNSFVFIECKPIKSTSEEESGRYTKNIARNIQRNQNSNHYETLSRYPFERTTNTKGIPSLKTSSPVTNDAVLPTQKVRKNTSPNTAPHTTERVVYGEDDREEASVSTDANLLKLIQADVALIATSVLSKNAWGNYDVKPEQQQPLTFIKGCGFMCSNEPFYNETILANCSGVLVGDQYVATAGHCLTVSPCSSTYFVFDFKKGSPMSNISSDNVYTCSRVVASQYTSDIDYAVIQLDRPVIGRTSIPIRRSGEVALGTPLYLVGHPLGTSMKVAGNASVKMNNGTNGYFSANTDSYNKNSGSMVVNGITWQVEGLLVRGNTDFEPNYTTGCCQSKVCSDTQGCTQSDGTYHYEEVSKVSTFASFIPWLWNGNLAVEPTQSTVYHYGIGSSFSSDGYQYTLYSPGPTNFTMYLSASYYGPLLVNGGSANSSGVLLGPDQNLTVSVVVNPSYVSAWNVGTSYSLTLTFHDDLTESVTTRQHVLMITDQPSPSATPSASPPRGPSPSASSQPSSSASPTASTSPSASSSPSQSPSATPSRSASPSASPVVEPAVCYPCSGNQDCRYQGICTNSALGSTKYCSCFSGYGGCNCSQQPSATCKATYGIVDAVSQKFQAAFNGSIQAGNLVVNVTANLQENLFVSVPASNGNNSYPYSQETRIYFGPSASLYPSCNFPRATTSGGVWKQLAAQDVCLDRYNFVISWDEAKSKCGFAPVTSENKTYTQRMTIVRTYVLSASSTRTETITQNVTITINEIPGNNSNVTVPDVNIFAAITLIEYEASTQQWVVFLQTLLQFPYQISAIPQHYLSGLLAKYGRLNSSSLSTVEGCDSASSQCQQNIVYTFVQGTASNACEGLEGGIITTANITCDSSLSAAQCSTYMATINPQVNISLQLHTGDGCTVVEQIEFSQASLSSFADSAVTLPTSNFDIQDTAYFGATVESLQAPISSRSVKDGSVCVRRGSTCIPVTYHTLAPSGGKEPVFSISFMERNNAAAFGEGSFTVEATIEVTFAERKRTLKMYAPQQLGLNTSIHITDNIQRESQAATFSASVPLLLFILWVLW